jgi:hypothetical protein
MQESDEILQIIIVLPQYLGPQVDLDLIQLGYLFRSWRLSFRTLQRFTITILDHGELQIETVTRNHLDNSVCRARAPL